MAHEDQLAIYRERVTRVIDRLQTEPAFADKLLEAPAVALMEFGITPTIYDDLAFGILFPHLENTAHCSATCIKKTSECTRSYLV